MMPRTLVAGLPALTAVCLSGFFLWFTSFTLQAQSWTYGSSNKNDPHAVCTGLSDPGSVIYPPAYKKIHGKWKPAPATDLNPAIIFNAQTGEAYWYDPSAPPSSDNQDHRYLLLPASGFVPPTNIREKVLIEVCDLHFAAQVTPNSTSISIPDKVEDIYSEPLAALATDQKSNISLSGSVKDLLSKFSSMIATGQMLTNGIAQAQARPQQATPACESPAQEQTLENAIATWRDKNKDFQAALKTYQDSALPHSFEDIVSGALSLETINNRLDDLEKLEPTAASTLQKFNQLLLGTKQSSTQAQALISALNDLVQQKTWTNLIASIDAEKQSINDYQAAQSALLATSPVHCDLHNADNNSINQSIEQLRLTLLTPNEVVDGLHQLNDRLETLENSVNDAYNKSTTLWIQALALSTSNSLTSVTLAITDPWLPFTIASSGINPNPFGAITSSTGGGTDQHQAVNNATIITIAPANGNSPGSISISPGSNTVVAAAPPPASKPSSKKSASHTPSVNPAPSAASPVTLTVTSDTPQKQQPQTPPPGGPDKPAAGPGDVTLLPNGPFLLERHKVVHFVATGGAFAAHEPTESYAAKQLPTTILTNIMSTVTTIPSGGTSSTSTTNNTTVTTGTEYVPYLSDAQRWHPGAVVGLTWFPGGLDTYSYVPRSHGHMTTGSFSKQSIRNLGLFLGSTVNTTGTFTFGPAYEITPGIELFVGGTLISSNSLALGVTPCHSIGTTLTSNTAPPSTVNTDVTDPTSGTRTITKTTTAVTTQTYCANTDATVLSDTNVPTRSSTHVGFTFSILLNSNLFKTLSFGK